MSLMSASQLASNQQAGEKYSHTIEQWILNAAASSISTRISQSSPRSLSRPSSANSLGSTGTALTTGTVLSQHSQISATQDIASMLDSLKKRGCELLDRLPGALSSELMLIISQGESILAQNMQALLVGTLMDVTKNEAEREKSGSDSGPGNWEEEENKELQLRELLHIAADVFDRQPSEHTQLLQNASSLASSLRCRPTGDTPEGALKARIVNFVKCAAHLLDILPADLAEDIIAEIMHASNPLPVSLRSHMLDAEGSSTQPDGSSTSHSVSEGDTGIDHVKAGAELVETVLNSIEQRLASDSTSLMRLGEGWNGYAENVKQELDLRNLNPKQSELPTAIDNLIGDAVTDTIQATVFAAIRNLTENGSSEQQLGASQRADVPAAQAEVQDSDVVDEAAVKKTVEESMERVGEPSKIGILVKIDGNYASNVSRTPLSSIPENMPVTMVAWTKGDSSVARSLNTILAVLKFNNLGISIGYDVFDFDGDGRISLRDLRKKCQELALEMSAEDVVELFQTLADGRTGHITREVWEESLASGDADSILMKRGVADIQVTHMLQDVMDDIIDAIVRQEEPPKAKDPKKFRGVSFSEEVIQEQNSTPLKMVVNAPITLHLPETSFRTPQANNRQTVSHFSIRTVKTPGNVLLVDQSPDRGAFCSPEGQDNIPAQVVKEENIPRTSNRVSKLAPEIVTKEDVPATINHAIEGLSEVLDQLQAAHVTSDGGTLAHAIESLSEVLDNLKSAHLHVKGGADLGPANRVQQAAFDMNGLDASTIEDNSLHVETLCTPKKPTSEKPAGTPRRRARPQSSAPQQPALSLEDNLLYKEFMRFGRGAWTLQAGFSAPPSSSAASLIARPTSPKNKITKNQIDLGAFLEFLKWADVVPRLTSTKAATGVYSCISKDSVAAGLDGQIGSLGWAGFQQCVGMVASLSGLTQVCGNDTVDLINASANNASGTKCFGIFPSEVAKSECEDGALTAFLEVFATSKVYQRFSWIDHNRTRGMTLDQALAMIGGLKTNPMFFCPSLVALEFRKVIRNQSPLKDRMQFPRTQNALKDAPLAKDAKLNEEQFRAMMAAISLRLEPPLVLRTVCISLAQYAAGKTSKRPDFKPSFDVGPRGPHQANPKAFLRPTRPSTAPRGLRLADRPKEVIMTENFLRPTPPRWRPSGPVDSELVIKKKPCLTPSTFLCKGSKMNQADLSKTILECEEADLQLLKEQEMLALRVGLSTPSSSVQSQGHQRPQSGNRSSPGIQRLEDKAREDYSRMLSINDDISLHHSICSWIDQSNTKDESSPQPGKDVEIEFLGGRVIRGGTSRLPQHLVRTAPKQAGRHKRFCPDPVYEDAPVLHSRLDNQRMASSTPRRGETILRQAHEMADKCKAESIAAKKRITTRLGGVQPFCEAGNWYMRSPGIAATSYPGTCTWANAQLEHGYRGELLDGMLLRFKILEEARSRWPAGTGTSQDYAKWETRQELDSVPHRGMW